MGLPTGRQAEARKSFRVNYSTTYSEGMAMPKVVAIQNQLNHYFIMNCPVLSAPASGARRVGRGINYQQEYLGFNPTSYY